MAIQQLIAALHGSGSLAPVWPNAYKAIGNVFAGGWINPDTGSPYGVWGGTGGITWSFNQVMNAPTTLSGEGLLTAAAPIWMQADFVWPGILLNAGELLLYQQAAGLEKALADVDAYRLTQTYAELIKDQWDPWRISANNLPYLAWAMGVNLWENTWSEQFKRWWVANQWTMKYERGSALGLKDFINTVNASPGMHAELVNLVVPPAQFFPGPALTDAQNAAYLARFPQLRLYPFAPRPQLPWLNYLGGYSLNSSGQPTFVKNGRFFGPLQKFYPTNYNAGGLYLRKVTVYDPQTGIETPCQVRTITGIVAGTQTYTTYDQVTLPANPGNLFYPGAGNKQYFYPPGTPLTQNRRHSIVLGVLPDTASRIVNIPRDGSLDITQYQAVFQTVTPGLQLINVRPMLQSIEHPIRKTEFYCGQPLVRKYFPKTNAAQYLYEVWYLFDPKRLPAYRKAYVYMGRARFGIPKYTAEADILASFDWPKYRMYNGGVLGRGRFFAPPDTRLIDQIRRAVTASMALRDTVLIDTGIKRRIAIKDLTVLDGRFSIGQYITDITA